MSLLARLIDVIDAALESPSSTPSGMLEKPLGRTAAERSFLSFPDRYLGISLAVRPRKEAHAQISHLVAMKNDHHEAGPVDTTRILWK